MPRNQSISTENLSSKQYEGRTSRSMARFWQAQLSLLLLTMFLVIASVVANSGFCGSVFETQVDHVLLGHVVSKATAVDEFECQLKCLEIKSCKSFNVHSGGNNVKRICELNNNTRQMKPVHFKWKRGSTYYGSVQVSCMDGSRVPSKRTQNHKCHPGYVGNRCSVMTGAHPNHPARSCKDIRETEGAVQNGEYWIDPENNGNPLKVYCDMKTDGGGWLLVFNVVIDGDPPTTLGVETSYRGISNYNNNNMVLATSALNELRTHLPFTQLRFHCNKLEGSTFHVTTIANSTGEAVVQYFSLQRDVMPYACGSFARLEGDNSMLAEICSSWGKDNGSYFVGKWGHEGMREFYEFPAFIGFVSHWATSPVWNRWECDHLSYFASLGDFWKIYVR